MEVESVATAAKRLGFDAVGLELLKSLAYLLRKFVQLWWASLPICVSRQAIVPGWVLGLCRRMTLATWPAGIPLAIHQEHVGALV